MTVARPAHALVVAPGASPPARFALFLHGILGSGANWRTFARRLVAAAPAWGVVLVDLRMHGASQQGFEPPHTVASAARDLGLLDDVVPGAIDGVVGHSFGGKVALEYVAQRHGALSLAWVLDASPGARGDTVASEVTLQALALLDRIAGQPTTREAFIARAIAEGFAPPIAAWLAMNLRREPGSDAHTLRLDTRALHAMLDDYFARDLWSVVESPPGRVREHLVIGGRSNVFDAADRARAQRAAERSEGRLSVHVLPDAGHWVHVDAPDGLFAAMAPSFTG